jgi:Domain of unknown function (DUF1929)/Galactose oxidase, central domain
MNASFSISAFCATAALSLALYFRTRTGYRWMPVLALCFLLFFIVSAGGLKSLSAAPAPITIGVTQVLTEFDNGNANLLLAQEATLSQAATIQSLSFYVAQAAGSLRLGIYGTSGTAPGSLLATTNSFTTVLGWNTANVITPVVLQPGTYWLAYLPSDNNLQFKKATRGFFVLKNFAYGPMPATFPPPSSSGPAQWSFYATLTPSSAPDPKKYGAWSGTVSLPLVAVHSALLPNGRVLMSDGQSFGRNAIVWDPIGKTSISVPAPTNIFCGAMEQMGDGRILVVGGHIAAHRGLAATNVFNPSTNVWTVLPNMAYARWYPTLTMLPDGRLIVTSGETDCDGCDVRIQETYNTSTKTWSQLRGAAFSFPYYPHVYVLPDGRILVAATTEDPIVSRVLDMRALTWTAVGGSAADGGSSAMYLPSKILKMGTSVNPDNPTQPYSVPSAYVLDMTQSSPLWRPVAPMAFPRTYHTATLLPDGSVLVTGGGTSTGATDITNAVLPAELWLPTTGTWTTLASMSAPRLYHSEALLLPDGRVLVCGGGRFDDSTLPTDQFSAEFFSPPYLFKGSRPAITSAPSHLFYGQSFTVNFTVQSPAQIAKVSLVRFGSVTHDINMSQRFLPLSFVVGNASLNITAPRDANLAPPGYYMLFLVDSNGVPSRAAVTHF